MGSSIQFATQAELCGLYKHCSVSIEKTVISIDIWKAVAENLTAPNTACLQSPVPSQRTGSVH